MSGLLTRVGALLAAVAIVGATCAYVGYVFAAKRLAESGRVEAMTLALEALARVHTSGGDASELADQVAKNHGIALLEFNPRGRLLFSTLEGPPPSSSALGLHREAGRIFLSRRLDDGSHIVAARNASDVYARLFASQGVFAGALVIALGLMLGAGLWLARTGLGRPLERLRALVDSSDRAGLETLSGPEDVFAELGRRIASMARTLDEDRLQMADQLAELKRTHHDLESTQSQLVRAERLAVVGTLAAGLAHEIGNPLAVVSGFVELLDDDLSPHERRRALESIERELQRMQSIVRNLLDFSRAPEVVEGDCAARDVVEQVVRLLGPQKSLANVEISVAVEPNGPALAIEGGALCQVLVNLVLNAGDAMEGKGKILIAAQENVITVDDSGPGIPEELRHTLFDPFVTSKSAGDGTGLGLSVCEQIVASAGGTLEASPERSPLGGARFVVTIPERRSPER